MMTTLPITPLCETSHPNVRASRLAHRVLQGACSTLAGLLLASTVLLSAQTTRPSKVETVVADFNHDGIPDLLALSSITPNAFISFGSVPYGTFNATPTVVNFPNGCFFASSSSITTGNFIVADFNADGIPDIFFTCVTSTTSQATFSGLRLGNGDGTFGAAVSLTAPFTQGGVAGDFNHDGKLDLVLLTYPSGFNSTGNQTSPSLLFFAGNGDGTFAAPVASPMGDSATFQATSLQSLSQFGPVAADVDGDGYPDILFNAGYGFSGSDTSGVTQTLAAFGNRKDGTFGILSQGTRTPDVTVATGPYTGTVRGKTLVGHFSALTALDLIVPNPTSTAASANAGFYFIKNTSAPGTFSLATAVYTTSPGLLTASTATFTGTGYTDLAIGTSTSIGALVNDGTATFTNRYASLSIPVSSSTAFNPSLFTAADANGDGYSDIYTVAILNNALSVAVNLVSGTATATSSPITLPIGNTDLSASWQGNLNYLGTSATTTQTVTLTPSAVTLSGNPNPAPIGSSVTFTAVVGSTVSTSRIPTGSVTFTDGSATLGIVTLDSTGTATLSTVALAAGTHTILAAYSGDTFFATATSSGLTQSITTAGQLTGNLLQNPGAELGSLQFWTITGPGTPTVDNGSFNSAINPHTGAYDFLGHDGASDSLSQTVSIVSSAVTPSMIDSGTQRADLSFWEQGLNQGTPSDDASVSLTFLDASANTISTVTSGEIDSHNGAWQNFDQIYTIPSGTRSIAYSMNFIRHQGSNLDAYIDDNSLIILSPAAAAATPIITWTAPASIPYGTPLSGTQLNAAATAATGASIPGTYTYTPTAGNILSVGPQTLSVLFTPNDTSAYTTATASVPLTVTPAIPTVTLTSSASTLTQGTVLTLTATVASSTTSIVLGQVNFCDASTTTCTDIHLLGTAQLTSAGTATLRLIPPAGSRSYKAVFLGTSSYATISSAAASVSVAATYPTATALTQSGTAGSYTLTATVTGTGGPTSPTGTVTFSNTTNPAALATATLGAATTTLTYVTTAQTTGPVPIGVLPYDLNGDGKKDLIVNNTSSATLSILLNNGDGTFTPATPLTTGRYPASIAAGDFNNDGNPDIAVVNFLDSTISIFLGQGNGTFAAPNTLASGTDSRTVATADFNHDGKLDLAVGHDNSVSIFLGNGDGTFTVTTTVPTGNGPNYAIATGDFNGDGNPDIAVTNTANNTISILLGDGNVSFTAAASPSTGSTPVSIAVGDLNGDGKLDLAVANQGDNTLTILLGNNDGSFTPASTSPSTGRNPQGVSIGDLDGDGIPDLAAANQNDNTVTILRGRGNGTFTLAATPATGAAPDRAAIADLDGDGIADLATSNVSAGGISILLTRVARTATAVATAVNAIGNGPQQATATYAGNTSFAASTSAAVTLTGQPLVPALTWTPAVASIPYGTPLDGQQLNATANTPGTFMYTPAAGTILPAGTQTLRVVFTPTNTLYTSASAMQTITVTPAPAIVTWPTPSLVPPGTVLSSTQLNATANIPGTFTYTPAAGTVLTATQTLSATFTPTDTANYEVTTASVQLEVTAFTLTAVTPNTASLGDGPKTITLTGTGFSTTSVARVNAAPIATTYVTATTLTAIVPASNFTTTGTLAITVANSAPSTVTNALPITVVPPTPSVTVTGPSTTTPGTQPAVALTIANPYPVPLTATFTLTFASTVTPAVDDPSIQFAAGGRTFSFTVPANSTTVPSIQLQAGTVAGTITIPVTLTAAGVNVTPATVKPVTIVVPAAVPTVSTATITRNGAQFALTIHGFSNTRQVSQATFHFVAATGSQIDTPDVTIPVTTIFSTWFTSTPSVQYGSTFTYTQTFSASDTSATIGSVQVTLTNSAGVSTVYTAQ